MADAVQTAASLSGLRAQIAAGACMRWAWQAFYSLNQEALSAQLRILTQRLKRRIIVMVLCYMVLCYRQINSKRPTIKFHWNFLGNIEIH